MSEQQLGILTVVRTNFFEALFVSSYVLLMSGCGQQAQIGADPKCFDSVDALWTAMGAKRTDLLEQTEKDLNALHSEGKLPDKAHTSLQGMIDTAKAGEWKSARADLRKFMEAQRRGR